MLIFGRKAKQQLYRTLAGDIAEGPLSDGQRAEVALNTAKALLEYDPLFDCNSFLNTATNGALG